MGLPPSALPLLAASTHCALIPPWDKQVRFLRDQRRAGVSTGVVERRRGRKMGLGLAMDLLWASLMKQSRKFPVDSSASICTTLWDLPSLVPTRAHCPPCIWKASRQSGRSCVPWGSVSAQNSYSRGDTGRHGYWCGSARVSSCWPTEWTPARKSHICAPSRPGERQGSKKSQLTGNMLSWGSHGSTKSLVADVELQMLNLFNCYFLEKYWLYNLFFFLKPLTSLTIKGKESYCCRCSCCCCG